MGSKTEVAICGQEGATGTENHEKQTNIPGNSHWKDESF